jgi:hypothetical protein
MRRAILLISVLLAASGYASEKMDLSPDALAKRSKAAFTVVWKLSHDTKADSAESVARIYADGWPGPVMWAMAMGFPAAPKLPQDANAEDIIAGKYGQISTEQLWMLTQDLCTETLGKHLKEFEKELANGIAGGREEQTKAHEILDHFRRMLYRRADWKQGAVVLKEEDSKTLSELTAALFPVAQKRLAELQSIADGDPLVYIFRELDDPRAIPLLVAKGHFDVLSSLQRKRPADPALVAKLSDPSPEIRCKATYSLSESGDPALVPHTLKLLGDSDARVREEAVRLAGNLQPKFTPEMDKAVKALLKDPAVSVRQASVRVLAWRQDAACAPELLEMLRAGLKHLKDLKQYTNQEMIEQGMLVDDMERLAESRFGYDLSAWPATTENNNAALEKFAAWMENKGKK